MSKQKDSVLILHSSLSNLLVGILTGSILSSIYNIIKYINTKGLLLFQLNTIITLEVSFIYYLLLIISYKGLFTIHHAKSKYTTEVMPAIDVQSPWVKHICYYLILFYLILYAFIPAFMLDNTITFLWLLTFIIIADLAWSFLLWQRTKMLRGRNLNEQLESFNYDLKIWLHCDIAFLIMSLSLALTLNFFEKLIVSLLLAAFLGVTSLYFCLSTFKEA